MCKTVAPLLLIIMTLIFCVSVSGCSAIPSLTPSPASGPAHSDESSPISSTQNANIVRSGDTITASGSAPYNTKAPKDPFLLKEGKATVNINLQGSGFGCSIGLNYKRPGSQSFELIQLYVMDSDRLTQVTKTVMLPYTGDYYLAVNWADDWTVTIAQ
jgi:hypothetical protein